MRLRLGPSYLHSNKIEGELTESDQYLDHNCLSFVTYTHVIKNIRLSIGGRNVRNS